MSMDYEDRQLLHTPDRLAFKSGVERLANGVQHVAVLLCSEWVWASHRLRLLVLLAHLRRIRLLWCHFSCMPSASGMGGKVCAFLPDPSDRTINKSTHLLAPR